MALRAEELLRRWFEDIWNKGHIDVADELLAPKGVLHETAVAGDGAHGLADFKAMVRALRQAFPDARFRIESIVQDGDQAAARLTVTGTHEGPGFGTPTGRSFRIMGIVISHVKEGRMIEGWSSFDMLGLFEQLGLVERPRIATEI